MATVRELLVVGLLAGALFAGASVLESPTGDAEDEPPDPDALWEATFVHSEALESIEGERTTVVETETETRTRTVAVAERPYTDYRTEVLEAPTSEAEGEVYVSNATVNWWYNPTTNSADYFRPAEPFTDAEIRDARSENAEERRALVEVEYAGTETIADREAHVLDVAAANETATRGIELLVGDREFVFALDSVDPNDELLVVETRVWIDAEYDYPLKEQAVFIEDDDERHVYTERFESVTFNGDIGDDAFAFEPPEDATVTDISG